MDNIILGAVVVTVSFYALLLIYGLTRRQAHLRALLGAALLGGTVTTVAVLLSPDQNIVGVYPAAALVPVLSAVTYVIAGAFVLVELRLPSAGRLVWVWGILNAAWAAVVAASIASGTAEGVTRTGWIVEVFRQPTLAAWLLLGGLGVSSLSLVSIGLWAFYRAELPEKANTALYWAMVAAVLSISTLLTISQTRGLQAAGVVALAAGLIGLTVGSTRREVFDVRYQFRAGLRLVLVVAAGAAIIFAALWLIPAQGRLDTLDEVIVAAALAAGSAVAVVLAMGIIQAAIRQPERGLDQAERTTHYSDEMAVANAESTDQIVAAVDRWLSHYGIRRWCILLYGERDGDTVMVTALHPTAVEMGTMALSSPVYLRLTDEGQSLSQFEIEHEAAYRGISSGERAFLRDLRMTVFVPMAARREQIGILGCGPKHNDHPFSADERDFLLLVAGHVASALMRVRFQEAAGKLQTALGEANQQVNKLEAVKSEFITISSHELRTPLAQIRGYIDILDALNEGGALDKDQASGMVGNLRRATERMEELIGTMLDVSQLETESMDFRMGPTTVETVVRMAIEPLTEGVKQRKLTLSARGLRSLPPIEGDSKRLVQAIQNVVLNAIKFTPDGGRIDINASIAQPDTPASSPRILITITDSGVGIEPGNLEMIFRKFYRSYDPSLHSTGTYKFMGAGPGLGLTLARGIIEKHGGTIWAESTGYSRETCPGATFHILLPFVTADKTEN
ncbi:MAG: GAF domain-containing protein [Anaerolineae bacterium]|nr:GAF domain-containing protein [Anaerolineae bacterium]